MSMTFPRARRSRKGYDIDEVEEFLVDARQAYTSGDGGTVLTAADIRRVGFTMRKGGYSPVHVDAALERLEDAFAQREREAAVARIGQGAWYSEARTAAQELLDRCVRPRGYRFRRSGPFTTGYHPRDVDAFTDHIARYFQHGETLTIEQVRTVAFRPLRGGYDEAQVDFVLETVAEIMLAVR